HQLHVYLDGSFGLLRDGTRAQGQKEDKNSQLIHRRLLHLDAGRADGVPSARGISAGKGSPSAQTAPSSKYSFFQMGTVRLRASISQRQASKATPRWAAATTIRTLVSPISRRPRRWIIVTSRTLNWASACSTSVPSSFKAMSS